MSNFLFTSESVTEGHPDKICDQISDGVLDAVLSKDPSGRVACETAVTTGLVMIMGEITTNCYVDIPKVARNIIKDIGYDNALYGFDYKSCSILTSIDEQSSDIALGVDKSLESKENNTNDFTTGAGDQGIMFGFACDETKELMPLPISMAHKLAIRLAKVRKTGVLKYLRPDGKTQVTVNYIDGKPHHIDTIVVSTQHDEKIDNKTLYNDIIKYVIKETIPEDLLTPETKYFVNPTGRFVIGGPPADSGLTGRKIIVDTYGGYSRHGGGAFSGKDPTKVDRSAAYMARYIAKNIVAASLAKKCEIQFSYAIGVANPVSVMVDTFNTGTVSDEKLSKFVMENFDLRPEAIISSLKLRSPIYKNTAAYGHFGREDMNFPWENKDKIELFMKLK